MILLAKILSPKDYGLVGMMSFFIGLSSVLVDMGLSSAILHSNDVTKKQLSSLYWLNVFLGFFLFLVLSLFSPVIANLYHEKQIERLILFMAMGLFANSFSFQHQLLLLKDFMFKESAIVSIIGQLLLFIISLGMALLNYGVYSLIIPNIIVSTLTSVYLIFLLRENYLPLFYFSFSGIKRFLNFSFFQTASILMSYINSQLDTLIIGYYIGAEKFGYYYVAKNLSLRPLQVLGPLVSNVSSPLMSKVNNDLDRLKNAYHKIVHFSSMLLFPIYSLMILLAVPLIQYLYGEKWMLAVFPLQIMSLISIIRGLISPLGSLVIATGKAKQMFNYNLILFVLFPTSLFLGSSYGTEGVLYSQLILMLGFLVLHFFVIIKPILQKISLLNFFSFFSGIFFYTSTLFVPCYFFLLFMPHGLINYFLVLVFFSIGFLALNFKYNTLFVELLMNFKFFSKFIAKYRK